MLRDLIYCFQFWMLESIFLKHSYSGWSSLWNKIWTIRLTWLCFGACVWFLAMHTKSFQVVYLWKFVTLCGKHNPAWSWHVGTSNVSPSFNDVLNDKLPNFFRFNMALSNIIDKKNVCGQFFGITGILSQQKTMIRSKPWIMWTVPSLIPICADSHKMSK